MQFKCASPTYGADDVTSQQAVRLLVGENLDESVGVGVRLGAAIRRHRKLPYFVDNALENMKHLTTVVHWALFLRLRPIFPKVFTAILRLSTRTTCHFYDM